MRRTKRAKVWLTLVAMLLVVAVAAGCGGSKSDDTTNNTSSTSNSTGTSNAPAASNSTAAETVAVEIKDFKYNPTEIRVKAGGTVTFTNRDAIAHNVVQTTVDNATSGNYGFESPQIATGQSWSYTFDTPGEYPILCTVGAHYLMGMTATVIVE